MAVTMAVTLLMQQVMNLAIIGVTHKETKHAKIEDNGVESNETIDMRI